MVHSSSLLLHLAVFLYFYKLEKVFFKAILSKFTFCWVYFSQNLYQIGALAERFLSNVCDNSSAVNVLCGRNQEELVGKGQPFLKGNK